MCRCLLARHRAGPSPIVSVGVHPRVATDHGIARLLQLLGLHLRHELRVRHAGAAQSCRCAPRRHVPLPPGLGCVRTRRECASRADVNSPTTDLGPDDSPDRLTRQCRPKYIARARVVFRKFWANTPAVAVAVGRPRRHACSGRSSALQDRLRQPEPRTRRAPIAVETVA